MTEQEWEASEDLPMMMGWYTGTYGDGSRDFGNDISDRKSRLLACACCRAACGGTGKVLHPLLAALRSEGPHYRGFWALDLPLGKE